MKSFFRNYDYVSSPLILTKVLNKQECHVSAVGVQPFSKKLCYRERGSWKPTEIGISHILFLSGTVHKEITPPNNYQAEFDIYLEDGRVIEVSSYDRHVIEAALPYAPQKDIRSSFRHNRGIL